MGSTHVRKGDMVVVISGIDAVDKVRGRVLSVDTAKMRVLVEGANMKTKHKKRGTVRQSPTGQRITIASPMAISNVALYCAKCDRGVRFSIFRNQEGAKQRLCKKCGSELPWPVDKK